MSGWAQVFLGAIAVATCSMALMQIGALLYAGRLARRVNRLAEQVEQEIKPLFASLTSISQDAARAASLAAAQVERADRLFADFSQRVEETMTSVQHVVVAPARKGFAILSGVRAALAALRELRDSPAGGRPGRVEDDDALFI